MLYGAVGRVGVRGLFGGAPPGPSGNGLVWDTGNYLIWGSGNYLTWGP